MENNGHGFLTIDIKLAAQTVCPPSLYNFYSLLPAITACSSFLLIIFIFACFCATPLCIYQGGHCRSNHIVSKSQGNLQDVLSCPFPPSVHFIDKETEFLIGEVTFSALYLLAEWRLETKPPLWPPGPIFPDFFHLRFSLKSQTWQSAELLECSTYINCYKQFLLWTVFDAKGHYDLS